MRTDLDVFDSALREALGQWGVAPSNAQHHLLRAHFDAVLNANRTINLTRITEPAEAAVKHYADSLSLLLWVDERGVEVESVLDLGTGAGFPAVPLAVMRPQWTVTAIDATAKKVRFLNETIKVVAGSGPGGLTNLRVEHAHAAHYRPGRCFDVVVSRALARLAAYLEQAGPLAAPGGWVIAYKTAGVGQSEMDEAAPLLKKLRLTAEPPHEYELQLAGEKLHRALLVYRKAR